MKIERSFNECFKYSLHDARIQKIEYDNKNLILYFDHIFSYNKDKTENTHNAKVIFENVDIDFVNFLVFDTLIKDKFKGNNFEFEEYKKNYEDSEFEVIVETYNWNIAVFQGRIWINNKRVDCIMNIYYFGKMIYDID